MILLLHDLNPEIFIKQGKFNKLSMSHLRLFEKSTYHKKRITH